MTTGTVTSKAVASEVSDSLYATGSGHSADTP